MIIDGHAYCFPPLGEANGFATREEHLRYLQREMADHHQPAWRLRDRAPGSNRMLADPQEDTLTGLTQVNFRSGGYGRFVWTVDGEDYAKQYLPPYLTHLAHSPEMLVAQMDYVGIDRAVLHATPIKPGHGPLYTSSDLSRLNFSGQILPFDNPKVSQNMVMYYMM
jgi:hypothetical protein